MKNNVVAIPMVEIPRTKYISLLRDREKLNALESAGVDNWEGYDVAMEDVFVEDPE